jgi:hypothetical protein
MAVRLLGVVVGVIAWLVVVPLVEVGRSAVRLVWRPRPAGGQTPASSPASVRERGEFHDLAERRVASRRVGTG